MPAHDALSVRTRVQEQLEGGTFKTIIDAFIGDVDERGFSNGAVQKKVARWGIKNALSMNAVAFESAMRVAETYYLSPEMHDIIQAASEAEDFPEDEAILREDPPSEAGFIYLPARFRMMELRGRLMIAHAALWFNNRIWWLCDRNDPDDEMNQELNKMDGGQTGLPRYDLMSLSTFDWGKPIPKLLTFDKSVLPTDAHVEFKNNPVTGEVMMFTDALIHPAMNQPHEQVEPALKFILTVWRVMQQTLAEVVKEEVTQKATRRYAMRVGIKNFGVNIIQLRRREGHGDLGTGHALTVRFPVRGHWRRIWCGPADNRYQRAIWVHPYIKGPENAPLIRRERINALVR